MNVSSMAHWIFLNFIEILTSKICWRPSNILIYVYLIGSLLIFLRKSHVLVYILSSTTQESTY